MTKGEKWSVGVAITAAVVALLSAVFSAQQANTAREQADRAAGRIVPRMEIVRMEPGPEKLRPAFQKVFPDSRQEMAHFDDPEALAVVNPGITVKNVGGENIESVRVEVVERAVWQVAPDSSSRTVPGFKPFPNKTHREDYALSEIFKPGDIAFLPITRPLFKAVLQASISGRDVDKCLGEFEMRCYSKATGSPVFVRAEKDEMVGLAFCWRSAKFTDGSCQRYTTVELFPTIGATGKGIGVR